jgi:hypothetical protein
LTSDSARDAGFGIKRADVRQASDSPTAYALNSMYRTKCWKLVYNVRVGLPGKGERIGMMVIVVRHGRNFIVTIECKEYVIDLLGII